MKIILSNLFNLMLFNLAWLGCVVGQNRLLWLTAPLIVGYAWLLLYYRQLTVLQLVLPLSVGIAVDSVFTIIGFFQFNPAQPLIPLWLVLLWLVFSTTLTQSLSFLRKSPFLAAFAGGLGFPFSYAMGEQLGAVNFGDTYLPVPVTIGILWAIALPMVYRGIDQPEHAPNEVS